MQPVHQNPRIISSTISLGTLSVVSMLLGLTGTIIITRHFSADEFGIYTLVLVLASFLGQMSTFGLELGISRFIAGAKDEFNKERFFSTAVLIRICAIVVMSILAWYGTPLLKLLFGQSLLPSFIVFVPLLFAAESLRTFLKATLQGCLLFPKMGIVDIITSSLNLSFLLIIVYAINGDITVLILSRIVSSFLASIFAFASIPIKKHISFDVAIFKDLLKFGFPLQLNDILGFIYSRIDTVAVAAFLGPTDIAIYEVARKIPDYLRNLYEPFRSVYYPFISKRYDPEKRQQSSGFLNDAVRFVSFVTLLGAVIAVLFGREILQLIFTEKYTSSAPVFAILMFNLSIALISNVMGTTLVAVGDSKKPVLINFFNAAASWIGSITLIPLFALLGASLANTIGTAVAFPLNRHFLRKKIELKDHPYLKPLALFFVWGLFVFIFKPETFLLKVVFLLVFLLACGALSIVTKDDIVLLLNGSGVTSWRPIQKLGLWISKL